MLSAFIQAGLANSTIYAIALIVLVLAIGLMAFLFARSSAQRKEREARVRQRMLEMEREAQFAAAADHVPISRNPADVALHIAKLLHEYMSMPALAVYAGQAMNANLSDMLPSEAAEGESGLPKLIPASLLTEHPRPVLVNRAILGAPSTQSAVIDPEPAAQELGQPSSPSAPEESWRPASPLYSEESEASAGPPADEGSVEQPAPAVEPPTADIADQSQTSVSSEHPATANRLIDEVMLLPWRGPFEWNGLIVAARPSGIALDALDPYREPIARLTDRLAVALEFERSDALSAEHSRRASRTTAFSRSLISCLEAKSPMDAIVREAASLVGADSAALWRVDDASGMIRMAAAYGLKSAEFLPLPVGQGLAGSVARSGETLAIEDAPGDPRCIFPREARESGIVSYLGAPLTADGKALGVVEVHCASRRSWSDSDRQALESAATIITELVKSSDSRGDRLRVESAYLGLSEALQRLRTPEEVQEAAVEVLGHALGASRVIVVEFNDQDKPEPVKREYRQSSAKSALGAAFGEGLYAAAAASVDGQPIAIANSQQQSLVGAEAAAEWGVLSELVAPIRIEGKTRAIVYIHQCDRTREWVSEEIEFAERVVRQLSLSLSNLRSMESAVGEAQQARADAQRAREINAEAPARIRELEQKLEGIARELAQSRAAEALGRGSLAKASALEAQARAEAEDSRRVEAEIKQQLERVQEEHKQSQGSAQQLLEINRLKSEFIVNAGHEMEASLQSVLGLAELLERGSYGALTPEQREAVHAIYGWARRIKSDIDWLVEYGSARSRRLEPNAST